MIKFSEQYKTVSESTHSHILDADIRVNKEGEYSNHRNTAKRGTILQALKNDHYEIKAGHHKGKIVKLSKETVVKADLGESVDHHLAQAAKHEAAMNSAKSDDAKSLHMRGMNLHKKAATANNPNTSEIANKHTEMVNKGSARIPHYMKPISADAYRNQGAVKHQVRESEQEEQMNEEMKKTEPKKSTPQFQKALTKARGLSTAGKGKSTPAFSDWLRKSRDESVELQELSNTTLHSYVKKAQGSFKNAKDTINKEVNSAPAGNRTAKSHDREDAAYHTKEKRYLGIKKAVTKISEDIEELDEASVKLVMGYYEVHHGGKQVGKYVAKYEAREHAAQLNTQSKKTKPKSVSEDTMAESSPFDWKGKKSEIDWKSDDKEPTHDGKHKGTYGSEEHKAKGDGSVAPKKSVGRPAGSYQGEYKKRDAAGKAASLAKSMASKAEGLAVRKEFKGSMDAAIKKRQLQIAGITK